jgi:hypothetical protein
MTRAKFECISVKETTWNKQYEFQAVTSGSPENEEFFKTTPAGQITISVKNDNVVFTPGKKYYIDFTEAE